MGSPLEIRRRDGTLHDILEADDPVARIIEAVLEAQAAIRARAIEMAPKPLTLAFKVFPDSVHGEITWTTKQTFLRQSR